jgi:hypothetical protein
MTPPADQAMHSLPLSALASYMTTGIQLGHATTSRTMAGMDVILPYQTKSWPIIDRPESSFGDV